MENRKMYYRHAKIKLFQRVVIDVQRCLEKTRTFGVPRDLVRLTTRDHLFLIWTFPGADPATPCDLLQHQLTSRDHEARPTVSYSLSQSNLLESDCGHL